MISTSPLITSGSGKYPVRTVLLLVVLFLINVGLGLVIPILSMSNSLITVELLYDYQPGMLSNEDVIAPYDISFEDEIATRQLKERNAHDVLPRFVYSMAESMRISSRLDSLVSSLESGDDPLADFGFDTELSSRWNALDDEEQVKVRLLLSDAVRHFLYVGVFDSDELAQVAQEGYETVSASLPATYDYRMKDTVLDIDDAVSKAFLSDRLIGFLQGYDVALTADAFSVLYALVDMIVEANVHYDALATQELRQEAMDSTPVVMAQIHEGDYILRYDTIVTEQALQTIAKINGITVDVSFMQMVGRFMFLSVILYVALYFIRSFIERKYRVLVYTFIFMITMALMLVLSYLSTFFFRHMEGAVDQVLPFLFLPLLMCQLTNRKRVGFLCGAVYACFILFFPTTDLITFFYLIFSIEISLLMMRFSVARLDMIYQGFYTALANIFIALAFHFIADKPLIYLIQEVFAIAVNVAITYMAISLLLPLLEHFLNIPTVFRLHELSSTDSPVLVRLRSQAIGTYNHSMNVSDMAYNAAKEIGANAELAKVGGLYHDIGKADHPEYFIENQAGGPNVHDDMKYTLSAAVIKSHVKLGVEKGKEVGLPQEVLDIIDQHHGNDIISYFYNKAMEEAKASRTPVQVNEEDFRYTSDIPQTKEAGIVMLADCFEAASRTLKKPTTLRYEKLFTSILVGKMNGNQLDECMLSMAEIEKIKRVFVHQAFGRDHMRIQYTKDEDNA